jgi:hypothetical protein
LKDTHGIRGILERLTMERVKPGFIAAYKKLFELLQKKPLLALPFIFLALCNFAALTLIYLGPRYPLSKLFAPPVRKIWGEQFLHYPQNFSLIPKLYNHAHVFISFTLGLFLTGIFIVLIARFFDDEKKKKIKIFNVFLTVLKKYLPMVLFFAVFYGINKLFFKLLGVSLAFFLGDSSVSVYCHLGGNFLVSVFLQTAFAFIFPAILLSGSGLFAALKHNVGLVKRNIKDVFIVVLIPSLLYVLVILNMIFMPWFLARFEPEVLLLSLSFNIIMTVLIDFFITGATTVFYLHLMDRAENQKAPEKE